MSECSVFPAGGKSGTCTLTDKIEATILEHQTPTTVDAELLEDLLLLTGLHLESPSSEVLSSPNLTS